MNEVTIQLPPEVQKDEAKLLLMIKLYETGKLSLGQAAKFSGYSKRAFYGVAWKIWSARHRLSPAGRFRAGDEFMSDNAVSNSSCLIALQKE
ncbi:MAG: UPF0175 family protein [candidate division KSB1 bacterium]|nr:UPF0175 family protein [candidate division KSB1 bacterium]